jgi:Bacterial aa3 type cytochrome c oxidase subunit IV
MRYQDAPQRPEPQLPEQRGSFMAIDPTGGHAAMDYPEHVRTYRGFLKATVYLIIFVVAVLVYLLTLVP